MTPNTRPAEGRTSPAETKLAGNGETVADEAVELALAAMDSYWEIPDEPHGNTPEGAMRAALEAAGYFALRDERAEVIARLGCHPAYVLAEIDQLQSRAEETPSADEYRQLRAERDALRGEVERLREQTRIPPMGDSSKRFPIKGLVWFRDSTSEWVLELHGDINNCTFIARHTQPPDVLPEDVPGLDRLYERAESAESALAAERERAEANARDARRYRWLRDRPRTHSDWSISVYTANPTYGVTQWLVDGVSDELQTERLDAAINAALAAQEGK
jgi:hypothetical protein